MAGNKSGPEDDGANVAVREYRHTTDSSQDRRGSEDFFLNNQSDALIIQNLFCYKILHVSGILSARVEFYNRIIFG
jgi:hypothetical protein